MFQVNVVEKIITRFTFSYLFFFNLAAYEIIWKDIIEQERCQYGAFALLAGNVRLQTHTQNM